MRNSWRKAGRRERHGWILWRCGLTFLRWQCCSHHHWLFIRVLWRCVISSLCKLAHKILYWIDWAAEPSKISDVRAEKSHCADTLWIWNLMLQHFPGKGSQQVSVRSCLWQRQRDCTWIWGVRQHPQGWGGVCWCLYQILPLKITAGRYIFHGLPAHQGSQLTAYESNNGKLKHTVEGKSQVWPSKHLSGSKLFSASFLGDLPIKLAFI